MGRCGRRCKQILDHLKEKAESWTLKKEALDHTVWKTCCGRGYGHVLRQTMKLKELQPLGQQQTLQVKHNKAMYKTRNASPSSHPTTNGNVTCPTLLTLLYFSQLGVTINQKSSWKKRKFTPA